MIDIRHLQYFQEVVNTGNYSRAAQNLHLSRQALAKAIKKIEEELSESLFLQIGNSLTLTPAGEKFLQSAKPVLAAYHTFEQEISQTAGPTLTLALSTGARLSLPHGTITRFKIGNPGISLVLENTNDFSAIEMLQNREADIALIGTSPRFLSDFTYKMIRITGLYLAVPETNPLYTKEYLTIPDLQGQPLVTAGPKNHLQRYIDEKCRQAGFVPNYHLMTSDTDILTAYARENECLYFAFPTNIIPLPKDLEVPYRIIPLETVPDYEFNTYAVRLKDQTLSPEGQALWNYLGFLPKS